MLSKHIDFRSSVKNTHGGVGSMKTGSGSRKRGSTSIMGARARRNALLAYEMEYMEELKEYIKSKRQRNGAGSNKGNDRMSECVIALESCKPRLTQA